MMKNKITYLFFLICLSTITIGQNIHGNDSVQINSHLIFDKWWGYDKSQNSPMIADQYFEKNGNYKCADPRLFTVSLGSWKWKENANNVMVIKFFFFTWEQRIISISEDELIFVIEGEDAKKMKLEGKTIFMKLKPNK
jgi:hypothetical protein